jgi:hypothetical protein
MDDLFEIIHPSACATFVSMERRVLGGAAPMTPMGRHALRATHPFHRNANRSAALLMHRSCIKGAAGRTNVRPASYAVSGERTFANGNAILGTFVPPCPWPQPRPAGKGTDAQAAASLCCASRTSTPTSLRSGCVYVRIHIGARRPTAFRFRCL